MSFVCSLTNMTPLFPDHYTEVYRKDRTRAGGGVFCAIREDVLASEERDLDRENECIWGSVQFAKSQKLYLGSFYRPPRAPVDNLEELENSLTDLFSRGMRRHPNIVIAGDFNAPDIEWANLEVNGNNDAINARKLLGMVDQFGLTQHQLEVTRPASVNTLDLVLCSNPNLVKSVEVVPGMSDHLAVLTTLDIRPKPYIKNHTRSSCIVRLTLMVSAETCPISRGSSCLQGWTAAHKMLTEVGSVLRMLSHQPSKSTYRHGAPSRNVAHRGSRDPSNLNSEERTVASCKARHTRKASDWTAYCKLRQHTQQLM